MSNQYCPLQILMLCILCVCQQLIFEVERRKAGPEPKGGIIRANPPPYRQKWKSVVIVTLAVDRKVACCEAHTGVDVKQALTICQKLHISNIDVESRSDALSYCIP